MLEPKWEHTNESDKGPAAAVPGKQRRDLTHVTRPQYRSFTLSFGDCPRRSPGSTDSAIML